MKKSKSKNLKLSRYTTEKLGYYVYLLIDPRDKKVFYIGKGYKKRVESHLNDFKDKEKEKSKKIKEIKDVGKEVKIDILRHGLLSEQAFEVESAIIDYVGIEKLTNIVLGHDSSDRGRMSLNELEIKYKAKPAVFNESVLLININKKYSHGMKPKEILEITKGNWRVSKNNVEGIEIICAVYCGIIREVFEVFGWFQSSEKYRKYFNGEIAREKIREKYIFKDVSRFWVRGNQNPIRYAFKPKSSKKKK